MILTERQINNFRKKQIVPTNKNKCYGWNGSILFAKKLGRAFEKHCAPYTRVNINGKVVYGHRVAWLISFGRIPPGMIIAHSCNRPTCTNIRHLLLCSQQTNIQMSIKEGRHIAARQRAITKYSEAVLAQARSLSDSGISMNSIAKTLGLPSPGYLARKIKETV